MLLSRSTVHSRRHDVMRGSILGVALLQLLNREPLTLGKLDWLLSSIPGNKKWSL